MRQVDKMHHNSPNDYVNWLRQQEGQLNMEEAQLAAEKQWLQQKEQEHRQQTVGRALRKVLQIGILLQSRYYRRKPARQTPSEMSGWYRREEYFHKQNRICSPKA